MEFVVSHDEFFHEKLECFLQNKPFPSLRLSGSSSSLGETTPQGHFQMQQAIASPSDHPPSAKSYLVKNVDKGDAKQEQQNLRNEIEQEGETQNQTPEKDLKESFLALPEQEQLEIIKRLEILKCDLIRSKNGQTETLQPTQALRDPSSNKASTNPEPLPSKGPNALDEAPQTLHQVPNDKLSCEIELDSHLSRALFYELHAEREIMGPGAG
uniref:Uncharacterized protein n=1 Tax=Sphaerodactylus townsendi TaxID=933632 RepID=A0ACB8EEN4_9SAUR